MLLYAILTPGCVDFWKVVLLICLMYAGDVLAQSTTPTVSSVAVTSNPGTDNEYATGDTIGE